MKKSLLSAVALTAMVAFSGTAWADILVGVGAPLTGPNAAFGAQIQKGAEQAAEDINAAGRINGNRSRSYSATTFRIQAGCFRRQKFVADGVKFVLVHINSGCLDSRIGNLMRKTASCR